MGADVSLSICYNSQDVCNYQNYSNNFLPITAIK